MSDQTTGLPHAYGLCGCEDGCQDCTVFQAHAEQPMPTPNDHPASADLALATIRQRDAIGQERYGTRLQPFNGRDSLRDAVEEMADGLMYGENAIKERDADKAEIARLRAENEALKTALRQFQGSICPHC